MFIKAKPIFLKNLQYEMNITGIFVCELPETKESAVLRLTGSTRYKVYLNGEMIAAGPARAAHGYARVEDVNLGTKGGVLRIDVASYNCRSYDGVKHSGFLTAEAVAGEAVIAATGYDFKGFRNLSRVQKVQRFSCQRHFSEVYHGVDELMPCEIECVSEDMKYIPMETPKPCMDLIEVKHIAAEGTFQKCREYWRDPWYMRSIPEKRDGFAPSDIEFAPYRKYRCLAFIPEDKQRRAFESVQIDQGHYAMCDFGRVNTGFIRAEIDVLEDAEIIISHEDYCPNAYIDTERMWDQYVHVIGYTLKAGHYSLENFDPIEMRYVQFNVMQGRIRLNKVGMRLFIHPQVRYDSLDSSDAQLNAIYDAAASTFRQNALDIYMDCPTRERAGWLCDGYYTAQAEYAFTGDNRIERVHLKNLLDAGHVDGLPKGMLPMCYPSDANGEFIPQWGMWYVLELEEALERSRDIDCEAYRNLCYDMVDFFAQYENEEGLLEKLISWGFVEWSKCNEWIQDVNYPTNFLYSRFLKAVGTMYHDDALLKRCERVRQAVIRRSFDGKLFTDNAVRNENGVLQNTGNTSETAQYYAIHFGELDLSEERFAFLKAAFENVFGCDHSKYASLGREITPSNAFMGIYLRIECLLERRMYDKVISEIKSFFGGMAELTGTLWEHDNVKNGSLNHGFASYVAAAIRQALAN